MKKLFDLTIKAKLYLSYAVFILAIVVGSGIGIVTGHHNKQVTDSVLDEFMPIVHRLFDIQNEVKQMTSMVGLFLLSQEQQYQQNYQQGYQSAINHIEAIKAIPNDPKHSSKLSDEDKQVLNGSIQQLDEVQQQLLQLDSLYQKVMQIGIDEFKNKPGLGFASTQLSPIFNQALQITTIMLESDEDAEEQEHRLEILKSTYKIRELWVGWGRAATLFLAYRTDFSIEELNRIKDEGSKELEVLATYADEFTFEQETGLEELTTLHTNYSKAVEKLLVLHKGDKWRNDTLMIRQEIGPLLAQISGQVKAIRKNYEAHADDQIDYLHQLTEHFRLANFFGIFCAILIGLIVLFLIERLVIRRIKNMQTAMELVSSGGGLNNQLDEKGSDELSSVAKSFNLFVTNIRTVVDMVMSSSSNLADEATKMKSITTCAKELAEGQQNQVSRVTQKMDSNTQQVESVANHSSEASEAVNEARSRAEDGHQVVNKAIQSIQFIASEVKESSQVVNTLSEDAQSIGSVVEVIQGISEQTNLLALNAAIEAARAGESGRGFAVVADEVRSLSQKIQQETISIADKVKRLQSASQSVLTRMTSTRENTTESVDMSSEAGVAFDNIVKEIATIANMTSQIAAAAEQQLEENKSISSTLLDLSIMSQTSAKSAEEASASGNEFQSMANQLHHIVGRFTQDKHELDESKSQSVSNSSQKQSSNLSSKEDDGNDVELF